LKKQEGSMREINIFYLFVSCILFHVWTVVLTKHQTKESISTMIVYEEFVVAIISMFKLFIVFLILLSIIIALYFCVKFIKFVSYKAYMYTLFLNTKKINKKN